MSALQASGSERGGEEGGGSEGEEEERGGGRSGEFIHKISLDVLAGALC